MLRSNFSMSSCSYTRQEERVGTITSSRVVVLDASSPEKVLSKMGASTSLVNEMLDTQRRQAPERRTALFPVGMRRPHMK